MIALGCKEPTDEASPKEYNIYQLASTLPTLYSALNIFDDQTESYFYFARTGTFLKEDMPNHVKVFFDSPEPAKLVKDKIKELYEKNNSNIINLYLDDAKVHRAIQYFTEQGIPEKNYTVTLLPDGAGSYTKFPYYKANSYKTFLHDASLYDNFYQKALKSENTNLSYATDSGELSNSKLYASQQNNFTYWLQYPSLFKSEDPKMVIEIEKANLKEITPQNIFAKLNKDEKEQFTKAAGLTDEVKALFTNSLKKDLIITGTYLTETLTGKATGGFKTVINRIVTEYSSEYDLFFKPHPIYLPSDYPVYEKVLTDANITILPGRLPMEVIMWNYPDLKIGGYAGSLFINASRGQTLFFIVEPGNAPDSSFLKKKSPLDFLYEDGFFNLKGGKTIPFYDPS